MDMITAIADPVRREILTLLRDRSMSAGEIASQFDISRPAVSRHLRVLRESGLVIDEIQGRRRIYHLDAAPLAPLQAWLTQLRIRWVDTLDALETEVYRTRREARASILKPGKKTA